MKIWADDRNEQSEARGEVEEETGEVKSEVKSSRLGAPSHRFHFVGRLPGQNLRPRAKGLRAKATRPKLPSQQI